MTIENDRDDLVNEINKLVGIIKEQIDSIKEKDKELEKMRSVDIDKNKDIDRLKADIEGYKERIKELEEIERIRVAKLDFKPASELPQPPADPVPMIWTPASNVFHMFAALRKAIDAHSKRRSPSDRIVFETDPENRYKIVDAFYAAIQSESESEPESKAEANE